MPTVVLTIINHLIDVEGGYVNHPDDRGGPTKYGITWRTAQSYGYIGDLKELPRDTAVDIYLQRYWTEPQFDRVAQLSIRIAEEMFDTGVNMGQATATRFLQRALNVLNKQGTTFPDLNVDGVLGSMSLYALKAFLQQRGKEGESVILKMLNAQQSVRYIEIAEKDPAQESFMYGWQKERVA